MSKVGVTALAKCQAREIKKNRANDSILLNAVGLAQMDTF